MQTVTVNSSKTYPVYIGEGLLKDSAKLARGHFSACRAAIVTDSTVNGLYADELQNSLSGAGFEVHKFVFSQGEASKTPQTLFSLLSFLAEHGFSRTDAVFALGGGVTGDIAGFAASIYMRGIRLVQLPTTLLACTDSSVGGKTAVNLPEGKNLAGSFYQPELVICDTALLRTLSENAVKDGFAEIIKYAVLTGGELFELLKEKSCDYTQIIPLCIKIKADFVNTDERDTGIRRMLNLGHTAAHAIEKLSDYSITHGSAVACGLVIAARAAQSLGICDTDCLNTIIQLLTAYGLPTETQYSPDELFELALHDKKRANGSTALILPASIGNCIIQEVDNSGLSDFFSLGTGG